MNQPNARTLTLFDLLARRWQVPAAVAAVRFAADGCVAFATADGAVRIAAVPDAEPPATRIRITGDLGQTTLRPREHDPAPLLVLGSLADGAPPLASAGDGFLVGDGDGRVLRLGRDGAATPVLSLGGPVGALDHADGVIAAADAATLVVAGTDGVRRHDIGTLRALAVSPGGTRVAASGADGLSLLSDAGIRTLPLPGAGRLAWRADGAWLAAALGADGLALVPGEEGEAVRLGGFPAPVGDVAWSGPAGAVAAAGAFRIAAWDAAALPATDRPLVTGQPGLVVVEAVAAHPRRPLLAVGYANGQVVIAQAGSRDELLLRQGGAAVTVLAFSPDGRDLAIGDADGGAAVVTFPDQIFK